jgi:hypothetical protein
MMYKRGTTFYARGFFYHGELLSSWLRHGGQLLNQLLQSFMMDEKSVPFAM